MPDKPKGKRTCRRYADFILSECFREAASAFSMIISSSSATAMPRALIHQSSSGLPISPTRRCTTPRPCGLRSYPTATKVVRARRAPGRSIHLAPCRGAGLPATGRIWRGGHEVQRKHQFRREGICLLGADLQTGGTAREDADPHFRSRNVRLSSAGIWRPI
jgi:hypothetical protein